MKKSLLSLKFTFHPSQIASLQTVVSPNGCVHLSYWQKIF